MFLHGSVINLLIKKKIQVGNIQVDDLAEGYNVVTSYKENTWKQSVKTKRDVVEICCFKVSYKQITWKQSVKINQDVVEICCFKEKKKMAVSMHLVFTAVNLKEDQSWSQTPTKVCLQRRLGSVVFPLMVKLTL